MNIMEKFLVGLVLSSALVGQAMAGVLVSNVPALGDASGQQSDANSSSYSQTFATPSDSVLDSITWWGFHTTDSGGALYDNFVVKLGDEVQAGALSITAFGSYFQYTLDIADVELTSSLLTIVNDSFDVEWFWQSARATGTTGPDASAVSFSLNGRSSLPTQDVPEPASYALLLLALGGLALRQAKSKQ